jgi:hypothetical protein
MAKTVDEYIAGLGGWQADLAKGLQRDILAAGGVSEAFKWGHPVYEAGGPVVLFKAHKAHVTLGFWRGQEMAALDPRLEANGSFHMASIKLEEGDAISGAEIAALVKRGIALNAEKGDPLQMAKKG